MGDQSMPAQPPQKRIKNFNEVALGYSKKQAIEEAIRCPQPTRAEHFHQCPIGIDVHGFIRLIREGNIQGALAKIHEQNLLPAVCGRACSAPCEKDVYENEHWTVPVRALERFACECGPKRTVKQAIDQKQSPSVAVIGSGPAGLVVAGELAKKGFRVTIFEALHFPGGILRYGIPEFRLPKKVLDTEIEYIKSLGVTIKIDMLVGQTITIEELLSSGYQAIFLGLGAGAPKFLNIPGEQFKGVYHAAEYLMRTNLLDLNAFSKNTAVFDQGKKIVIIGKGGMAVDCARIAIRFGKEVTLTFEGAEEELTGQQQEIAFAREEGVKFEFFVKPLEIISAANSFVRGLKCIRVDYADPEGSGSWQLTPVEGSQFDLDADTVIISAGYRPNPFAGKIAKNLKINQDGTIWTKEHSFATSLPGVFAGGDVAHGAGPMIKAIVSAKKAAEEMHQFLMTQAKGT